MRAASDSACGEANFTLAQAGVPVLLVRCLKAGCLFAGFGGRTLVGMEDTPSTRLPHSIFFFLLLAGLLQANYQAAHLPRMIATHFGKDGMANGWQTKGASFYTEAVLVLVAASITFGLPRLLEMLPVPLWNLPNKEYWFAPERRANTVAYFRAQFAWFGCALLAFLLVVYELVFRANLVFPHQLNTTAFLAALFTFLAFVLLWTIRLIMHFSKAK
jgi:uncharacterized membrane protein